MSIQWDAFTPWSALGGGALIGMAASLLLLANGRVAGVSGILTGLLARGEEGRWRLAFVLGMLVASLVAHAFVPGLGLPAVGRGGNALGVGELGWLLLAGVLVGIGTRMANGCTSGHGVCGLARLSLRSLLAVLVFMGTGFVTVFVVRHVLTGGGA